MGNESRNKVLSLVCGSVNKYELALGFPVPDTVPGTLSALPCLVLVTTPWGSTRITLTIDEES